MPSTSMFHTPLWATASPARRAEVAAAFMAMLTRVSTFRIDGRNRLRNVKADLSRYYQDIANRPQERTKDWFVLISNFRRMLASFYYSFYGIFTPQLGRSTRPKDIYHQQIVLNNLTRWSTVLSRDMLI
jgi:hypothetical protein